MRTFKTNVISTQLNATQFSKTTNLLTSSANNKICDSTLLKVTKTLPSSLATSHILNAVIMHGYDFTLKTLLYLEKEIQVKTEKIDIIVISFCLNKKTYKAWIEITEEDLMRKEKFLTDYHINRFLAKYSALDISSIVDVLVNISNLLRLSAEEEVDELHFTTFRVVRLVKNNKTYFLITQF